MQDDAYLETRVMTAPPHQLHLLVVDGALRHARRALEALESDDGETAHFALNDARSFVAELIGGLDAGKAPEIVENLKQLFTFVHHNFFHADVERSPQRIRDGIRVLELHRETWVALGGQLHASSANAGTADARTADADGSAADASSNNASREFTESLDAIDLGDDFGSSHDWTT